METNALPPYDASDKPTGCCPRFNPQGWDNQVLHFRDKPFVKVRSRSLFHIPLNIGRVFTRTIETVENALGKDGLDPLVLTDALSPWTEEHHFAVKEPVDGLENETISGDFLTKVFEGPYKQVPSWAGQIKRAVEAKGRTPAKIFFYFTTCPECAKAYGQNYVVGVAEMT